MPSRIAPEGRRAAQPSSHGFGGQRQLRRSGATARSECCTGASNGDQYQRRRTICRSAPLGSASLTLWPTNIDFLGSV